MESQKDSKSKSFKSARKSWERYLSEIDDIGETYKLQITPEILRHFVVAVEGYYGTKMSLSSYLKKKGFHIKHYNFTNLLRMSMMRSSNVKMEISIGDVNIVSEEINRHRKEMNEIVKDMSQLSTGSLRKNDKYCYIEEEVSTGQKRMFISGVYRKGVPALITTAILRDYAVEFSKVPYKQIKYHMQMLEYLKECYEIENILYQLQSQPVLYKVVNDEKFYIIREIDMYARISVHSSPHKDPLLNKRPYSRIEILDLLLISRTEMVLSQFLMFCQIIGREVVDEWKEMTAAIAYKDMRYKCKLETYDQCQIVLDKYRMPMCEEVVEEIFRSASKGHKKGEDTEEIAILRIDIPVVALRVTECYEMRHYLNSRMISANPYLGLLWSSMSKRHMSVSRVKCVVTLLSFFGIVKSVIGAQSIIEEVQGSKIIRFYHDLVEGYDRETAYNYYSEPQRHLCHSLMFCGKGQGRLSVHYKLKCSVSNDRVEVQNFNRQDRSWYRREVDIEGIKAIPVINPIGDVCYYINKKLRGENGVHYTFAHLTPDVTVLRDEKIISDTTQLMLELPFLRADYYNEEWDEY